MSFSKIAAENYPPEKPQVVVREYDDGRDKAEVEELERRCEVWQPGKPSLVTDLMGDPIARVRNFLSHIMLIAEYGDGREIVGVIRGCIKTVANGKSSDGSSRSPVCVKLAYILGLRVSSAHRRVGIATKLVQELEEWCKNNGAEYAYMATECTNKPSLNLFTQKCNYVKFRNPTVLVRPVHLHCKPLPSDITIIKIPRHLAASMYRDIFSSSEFFPNDVHHLLNNELNLGTFMAVQKKYLTKWNPKSGESQPPSSSLAILSVWNAKQVYRLKVKGVSGLTRVACMGTRVLDLMLPWLKIPSVPNVFNNFGFYFMYGLHMEGKHGLRLMKALCKVVHNMGRNEPVCRVVVAEVAQNDPVREAIPHWKKFSWDEDIWCIKRFTQPNHDRHEFSMSSSSVIFVDPRDL